MKKSDLIVLSSEELIVKLCRLYSIEAKWARKQEEWIVAELSRRFDLDKDKLMNEINS